MCRSVPQLFMPDAWSSIPDAWKPCGQGNDLLQNTLPLGMRAGAEQWAVHAMLWVTCLQYVSASANGSNACTTCACEVQDSYTCAP